MTDSRMDPLVRQFWDAVVMTSEAATSHSALGFARGRLDEVLKSLGIVNAVFEQSPSLESLPESIRSDSLEHRANVRHAVRLAARHVEMAMATIGILSESVPVKDQTHANIGQLLDDILHANSES